jgi:hypothetical protein
LALAVSVFAPQTPRRAGEGRLDRSRQPSRDGRPARRPVAGLTAEAFEIREGGIGQNIVSFVPAFPPIEVPLHLGLMPDSWIANGAWRARERQRGARSPAGGRA